MREEHLNLNEVWVLLEDAGCPLPEPKTRAAFETCGLLTLIRIDRGVPMLIASWSQASICPDCGKPLGRYRLAFETRRCVCGYVAASYAAVCAVDAINSSWWQQLIRLIEGERRRLHDRVVAAVRSGVLGWGARLQPDGRIVLDPNSADRVVVNPCCSGYVYVPTKGAIRLLGPDAVTESSDESEI